MKNMIIATIFSVFCIVFWSSCASTVDTDIETLSTDLDTPFTDSGDRFTIKPPLDWTVKEKGDDWSFTPEVAEIDSRKAKAKLVIQYIKIDTMHTPEEFRDFIKYEIENTENVKDYKIIEYGGTPSNAYCNLMVEYDSSIGKSTHYFRNILTGKGYYRVSGSALSKYWKTIAPLLIASIATFNIKQ